MNENLPAGTLAVVHPQTGEPLWLLPEGGLFDPASNSLFVADVHLGKAESFRRLGVPVPIAASSHGMVRLSALLARYRPARLVFLGDLIHDRMDAEHPMLAQLAQWRQEHADVSMLLVPGNHDRKGGALARDCGIDILPVGSTLGALQLLHEPDEISPAQASAPALALAGHLHPVIRLHGRGDTLRLRCFWWQPEVIVLPAFGEFTGGHAVRPAPNERIFLLADGAVREMPVRPRADIP